MARENPILCSANPKAKFMKTLVSKNIIPSKIHTVMMSRSWWGSAGEW